MRRSSSSIRVSASNETPLAGRVLWARPALVIVAWAFVAALLVQALLAGLGVFAGPGWWPRHLAFANWFQWLSPIGLGLAFVARASRAVKWLAGATVLLLGLQYVTAGFRTSPGRESWAALHPVSAMLLFWAATELARRAGERRVAG